MLTGPNARRVNKALPVRERDAQCRLLCRFSERRHDDPIRTRRRQAYEKRQWTKSREAARLRCGGLYEGLIETPALMVRDGTSRDEVDGAFKRVMVADLKPAGNAHNPSVLARILSK